MGDCGLTGRKIIVDTYGGMARHGGGAFSGKDPSKVDRSAAYAARYVAKNVVAAGLADRCEVQVAYAIGVAHPVSVMVETFGTEKISRSEIAKLVRDHFDLRPGAFREYLKLHRPIFQKTAAYGHFGREDSDFTWEKTDKVDALRQAAGLGEREGAPPPRSAGSLRARRPAHPEQRHRLGQALEPAAAGERPGVVALRRRRAPRSTPGRCRAGRTGRSGSPCSPPPRTRRRRGPSAGPRATPAWMDGRPLSSASAASCRSSSIEISASVSGDTSITASPTVLTSRTGGTARSVASSAKRSASAPELRGVHALAEAA